MVKIATFWLVVVVVQKRLVFYDVFKNIRIYVGGHKSEKRNEMI